MSILAVSKTKDWETKQEKKEKSKNPPYQYQNTSPKSHILSGKCQKKKSTHQNNASFMERHVQNTKDLTILLACANLNQKVRWKWWLIFLPILIFQWQNVVTFNWTQEIKINNTTTIKFKLDTTTQVCI